MNILLLGNGFDLHYNLPTKYHNFLHTANYLINNYSENIKSVGDIFSNSELQKVDKHIANSYSKHAELYNSTALDVDKTAKLIDYVNNNIWFKYLLKSFNKDVGWIDFETEIAVVIKSFNDFFVDLKIDFSEETFFRDEFNWYIINNFDFFYKKTKERYVAYGLTSYAQYSVRDEYIIEYPLGSGIKIVNTEKIIKHLSDSL